MQASQPTKRKTLRQIHSKKSIDQSDLSDIYDILVAQITTNTRQQTFDPNEQPLQIDELSRVIRLLYRGMQNGNEYVDFMDRKVYKKLKAIFRLVLTTCTAKGLVVFEQLKKEGVTDWMLQEFFAKEASEIFWERRLNAKQLQKEHQESKFIQQKFSKSANKQIGLIN